MGIFDRLPTVQKCCCCINLKIGCFIIGIVHLLVVVDFFCGSTASILDKCKDSMLVTVIVYIYYALSVIMLVISLLFLYGLIKHRSDTNLWFMWGLVAVIVFQLIYGIIMLVSGSSCSLGYSVGGSAIIGIILTFYFLVVVNSYHGSAL